MVNLTARVSESQKGQRKLMARTREGFSQIYGCFMKWRLEVISGWTRPVGRCNHKRRFSVSDILLPAVSHVRYIFRAAASQSQNKAGLTSRFCTPASRRNATSDVFNPATNCSESVLWFNLVVLSERQHSNVDPLRSGFCLNRIPLTMFCLSSPPFGHAVRIQNTAAKMKAQ